MIDGVTNIPVGGDILQGDLFAPRGDRRQNPDAPRLTFVNAFAGCGGLGLGLLMAGWEAALLIEHRQAPWDTITDNLSGTGRLAAWPDDIEKRPWALDSMLAVNRGALHDMAGHVGLLAGTVPCGVLRPEDPANRPWQDFLTLASILQPSLVLIESTPAFLCPAPARPGDTAPQAWFALHFQKAFPDYQVVGAVLRADAFGIPQHRRRAYTLAARRTLDLAPGLAAFFDNLAVGARQFLTRRGLPLKPTAADAIGDLEGGADRYEGPQTAFQAVMHRDCHGSPPDRRTPRHDRRTIQRFRRAMANRAAGRHIRVLRPERPAPAVPERPEDLLHYSQARTLCVREAARLQGFPDHFRFCGPHNASGSKRNSVMPRFAQAARSMPPLLAEQFGEAMAALLHAADTRVNGSAPRNDASARHGPQDLPDRCPPQGRECGGTEGAGRNRPWIFRPEAGSCALETANRNSSP